MDHKKNSLLVQTASIPVYYKNFHCLSHGCRDNCCWEDWGIYFDKKDFLRLRRLDAPADLREKLAKGVRRVRGEKASDQIYGCFDLNTNDGCCPFLDEDRLCGIQRACGHEALPHVCTSYPRHFSYSPAAREYSLSPSCEGVLEQLWQFSEGIKFTEEPLPKEDCRAIKIVPGDNLMRHYAPVRRVLLDILQNRSLPLPQRLLYLGITLQRLQKEDWNSFDPEGWAAQALSLSDSDAIRESLGRITGDRMLYITQNLKVLAVISRSKHKPWIDEVFSALAAQQKVAFLPSEKGEEEEPDMHLLMDFSIEGYEEALAEFEAAFAGQEHFFENLAVATALYLEFPSLTSREKLWKSYISLCNIYSFFHFVAVAGCKGNATKERLFHLIVMASRSTLHNRDRFLKFREELFQHNSSSLAHMAILLNG